LIHDKQSQAKTVDCGEAADSTAETPMSLLKTEPAGAVTSLTELFAIAYAMEQEAAGRYAAIATRMRSEGESALAAVFESLAADERGHIDKILDWSRRNRGEAPDPAKLRWTLPETFDDEGAATRDPRLQSAHRVLSMAVRNEERAFAFWSYVAAHAGLPEIRKAAEALAHEELGHVALLRRERRKVFHLERDQRLADEAGRPSGLDAAALERRLADALDAAARGDAPRSATLRKLATRARSQAEQIERSAATISAAPLPANLDAPLALAELLVERYLEAADKAADETEMTLAQSLAAQAIDRLTWLRTDLPELS